MDHGIENIRATPPSDPYADIGETADEADDTPDHPLDSAESQAKFRRLREWYEQERERQAVNRYQQALDEDFYDGIQYSDEDIDELNARGQAPLVFNKIKPSVDWILGTEKRSRVDFKILPRNEAGRDMAEVKTRTLKYVSDVNKTAFERSLAFEDAVKVGIGWLEDGARDNPEEEILYSRRESWRNVLYDSNSVKRDLSDARYLFRWRWVDLDIAVSMFPSREAALRRAAVAASLLGDDQDEDFWYLGQRFQATDAAGNVIGRRTYVSDATLVGNRRARVKLIECWYREPAPTKVCCGDLFDRREFDAENTAMQTAVAQGMITLVDRVALKVRCAVMTDGDLLQDMPSPYRHNRFPLTPIWCYRRGRDNAPYGTIRNIRDPQEDLNKRASKALFILSTNQVIAEKSVIGKEMTWDELREEAARPDGIIVLDKDGRFEIRRDVELAEEHLQLMEHDARMIQDIGGTTDENLGRKTNATSGKAIRARQEQGGLVMASPFDNLRYAIQLQGEKQLSLIEQFYTDAKVIRLSGAKGRIEWIEINQPETQPDGSVRYLNDITAEQADFVVDEQDFSATIRMAMFEELMEVISKLPPEVGLKLLDVAMEMANLPEQHEVIARIRKINGFIDTEKMTPEEKQAHQAQQQQQDQAAQLQTRLLTAKVAELEAKVGKTNAEALTKRVAGMYAAMQAAGIVVAVPDTAPVADELLRGAGWKDEHGQDPNIPQPAGTVGAVPTAPANPNPMLPATGAAGAMRGIETPRNDGAQRP